MAVEDDVRSVEKELLVERDTSAGELLVPSESNVTPRITFVMPTLNEEAGIQECMERIRAAVEELGVFAEIIISDSSTDRTPEIARELGAIVVEPDQPGYGYAYRYAFEHARGDYIIIGDADVTYDFSDTPRLLKHLIETDADMVMGSRLEGEIEPGAMPPLHRYVGNPLLTRFLNAFYGAGVSDAHSGFRVIRREALEELDLETTGMEFASEMIMEAGAHDMRIEEVPITYHERKGKETLRSFRDGWRHVRFMLVNAPGYLFSVPGVVLGVIGVFVMGLVSATVTIGGVTLGVHSMIAGSLLLIVGYQVASMGVFATVSADPIRRPTDPVTTWIVENLTLERGATAGLVLSGTGTVTAVYLVLDWFAAGVASIAFTETALIAFTAIVLGVQTIFGSFFLSAISEK